jgi:hypothetical protein
VHLKARGFEPLIGSPHLPSEREKEKRGVRDVSRCEKHLVVTENGNESGYVKHVIAAEVTSSKRTKKHGRREVNENAGTESQTRWAVEETSPETVGVRAVTSPPWFSQKASSAKKRTPPRE